MRFELSLPETTTRGLVLGWCHKIVDRDSDITRRPYRIVLRLARGSQVGHLNRGSGKKQYHLSVDARTQAVSAIIATPGQMPRVPCLVVVPEDRVPNPAGYSFVSTFRLMTAFPTIEASLWHMIHPETSTENYEREGLVLSTACE